jgi:hypothetical protein
MHRLEHARRSAAVRRLLLRGDRRIRRTQLGVSVAVERPVESGAGDGGSDPHGDADGRDQRRRVSLEGCRRGRRLHRQR